MKIAIASGKGGTGKTFVSTNIFFMLVEKGEAAILVDCDAEAPNAIAFFDTYLSSAFEVTQQVPVINPDRCTFCGKCHEYCSYNAIFILLSKKIINVMEDLCHGCGACSMACKYGAISEKPVPLGLVSTYSGNRQSLLVEARMNIGVMSPVRVIKAAIQHTDDMEGIVILDSPPGTSCPFIQTVSSADYVILVTEPTPFGLSDLRQSIETFKKIGKPCGVIINRTGLGNDDVRFYLEKEKIPLLLEIPFDKEIAGLYSKGEMVAREKPAIGEQFYGIIKKIAGEYGNSRY